MPSADSTEDSERDFVVPYDIVDRRLNDDEDTEQHKVLRGHSLRKRHIRHYRHATGKWTAAIEGFHPLWFAICISSGGLALILNGPFPYRAHWQVTIATILYLVELVLFFFFMIIMLMRWIIYPHAAIRRAQSDADELGAYAIPPIALMTLGSLTASQVSLGSWGGHAFMLVAYVLWWIGTIWIFLTAVVVLTVLFYTGNVSDRVMTPVLFMAPVGLATAGAEAGFITIYSCCMSARLAVPQLVIGYFATGIALFMAILLYTVFLHRLLASGWIAASKRGGLFILIGPCGQLSTAFQLLGESASQYMRFADYKPMAVRPPSHGTFWTEETARGVDGAGILLALLLLGFAYLWGTIAVIGVIDAAVKREIRYTLTWWAIVFPTVTLTTAWLELAASMDSPAFRALVSALTVFITIGYFVNWAFTLRGIFKGDILFGKTQLEIEDGMLKKAQDEEVDGDKQHV